MQMQQNRDDRSLGDLFSELTSELRTLVRQELELAKVEMSRKASRLGKDVAFLALGGAIAYAGFLVLLSMLVIALAYAIPLWLSALLVGALTAGIGYFLIERGRARLKQEDIKPEQTIETLKEDQEWAKRQMT
jgi:uncharacterized membrane protein YqjE